MRQLPCLAVALVGCLSVSQAAPVEAVYVGPSGTFDEEPTNYTIANNWSPSGVPNNIAGSVYSVTIPKDVFVDIPITVNQVTINAAASFTIKDTADAAGTYSVGVAFDNEGALSLYNSNFSSHGTFPNFDASTGTLNGGSYFLQGFDLSTAQPRVSVFEFGNANIITNNSSITVINHAMIVDELGRDGLRNLLNNTANGSFVVGSGYSFTASGNFTTAGTVVVQPALPDVNGFPIGAGSFVVLSGHEYLQTVGSTTVNGSLTADLSDFQGGTISLGGTIAGPVTVEGATLLPMGQTGPTITGDLALSSASALRYSIPSLVTIADGQFTSGAYDHLTVGGSVVLGGSTLVVQVATGYPISSHSIFTILDSTGAVSGKFGNVTSGSRLTTEGGLGSFLVSLSDQALQLSDFQTTPPAAQFANLSTRGEVLIGDSVLIGGFIVNGTQAKNVLLRALGPSLADQGIAAPLSDPVLELHDSAGATIASNDNWQDTQKGAIEATGIPPVNDLESAIVASLQPGAYTLVVYGKNGVTGTALVEAYDLSPNVDSTLSNLSTRGFVDAANPLIGGFIAGGTGTGDCEVVARAIGPDLGNLGIANPLADPVLEVRDVNGDLVVSNDDYVPGSDPIITLDGLAPADSHDAAVRLALAPGNYTALVLAKGSDSGIALVELYDLYH